MYSRILHLSGSGLLAALLFICLSVQAQTPPGQRLSAYVDRTDISLNDIITLTIKVDASLSNNRPSMAGLNRDFEQVGGINTRSTYTNVNGKIQSWTEYSIMLRPLATGTFSIPSFRVDTELTNPITIKVSDAAQPANGTNDEIFLSTTVSKDSVYVQEQLLYTIRIYYSIGFDQGAQLSSPQVADAVVQQLGSDENFQEVVGGIGYNVTERRFVIYPQSSGQLLISPVYFDASVGRRGGINRFFNNRTNVREIQLVSEEHSVEVKPRPASFPGQTWLPASELSLTESWSDDLDTVVVGDAITRNVELTTRGLSSSLLPGIEYDDLPGLRFYPDQPVRADSADRNGVVGKRSEGTAIVASRAGEFVLPEVRLPWWNTTTDTLETAILPARTITVVPATGANGEPEPADNSSVPLPPLPSASPQTIGMAAAPANPLWIATTVLFAVAWILTLFLWLHGRRRLVYAQTVGMPASVRMPEQKQNARQHESHALPEANASLRVLKTACENENLPDVKKAVIKWGQASFRDSSIQTLAQLAACCRDEKLESMFSALDAALYASAQGKFNSKAFYNAVITLHKQGVLVPGQQGKYALPPLYKN